MSISVTFSSTNGGLGLSAPLNHGNIANGSITVKQTIHIRHNGVNPITSSSIYCTGVDTTEYTGSTTASTDKTELLSWGDASLSNDFGGVQFNLNATGAFPNSSWPVLAHKTSLDNLGYTIRTGIGDSSSNGILIPSATGATSTGTIQAGSSPNVRFQSRIVIPQNVSLTGVRQFKMAIAFTYTS